MTQVGTTKSPSTQSTCPNCTRPFETPPQVVGYKRFCSDRCRSEWHSKLRKRALEALRVQAGATMQEP